MIVTQAQVSATNNRDDLYSSVALLEYVLNIEKIYVEALEDYILKAESEIKSLKKATRIFRNQTSTKLKYNSILFQSLRNFQQNAESNLTLIYQALKDLIKISYIVEFLRKVKNTNSIYEHFVPIQSDFDGAISGLLRLQRIYGFTAEQLVKGNLSDIIQLSSKLTAYDCFKIGQKLSDLNIHEYAVGWYKAALNHINETQENTFNSYNKLDSQTIAESLKYSKLLTNDTGDTDKLVGFEDLGLVQLACRGYLEKEPYESRELHCKYENQNHPFLKLAPLKVEILNLSPYLVIYHNVIYDSEIEVLKELSQDNLERAGTWNNDEGKDTSTTYRTSKHSWIDNGTHPVVDILNQRMYDMTGLSLETSETLQIANYGIGGHYDIHVDYSEHSDDPRYNSADAFGSEWGFGDRIATILFYLSDVPLGGSTVWPYIKVKVNPVRGNAAFWYNLHYSLEGNVYTLHSSCPVVIGSKWAANKWIWSQAQIFKRPCQLEFDTSVEEDIEI
ncbi:prolyl 4-hydroxylase subunit alpha-2-like [Condylostylus longicornis]|uniref:prolyl 4-hydroxylase subunit alpha-2-like n=1 Tax=Condylostylus longicornis TaxID=2530218 RepID=UPI00244DEF53|nr:prolyl 4-hydroxylase subunit alpha-2-like [Condylostylus longicornis]